MKNIVVIGIFLFFSSFLVGKEGNVPEESIPRYLMDCSVMVVTKGGSGSGVVATRNNISYVWTAGHVIEDARSERKHGEKKIIEFDDVEISRLIVQKGRTVARLSGFAEVIRYSDSEHGHDLALLKIRMEDFPSKSTRFYLDKEIPEIDCDLYHCGSLLGELGANSVTRGNLSAVGRLIKGRIFDQSDCRTLPGSSGGGIFLRDGRCIGLLLRGASSTFSLHVPVRRIREYASKVGVDFTIDPSLPIPSDKDLSKFPIEALN